MKLSSWMALGAIIGRETCPGKRGWKDAALAAILTKNEIFDKDGVIRKLIDQGTSDSEIQEIQEMLDKEMEKRQSQRSGVIAEKVDEIKKKRGFFGAFVRGLTE